MPSHIIMQSLSGLSELLSFYVYYPWTVEKNLEKHDDVIKWKHFPRNWPFVREIHRSPVNFPHKGQWRGALMFSLMYAWINDWVNNREAGDLRLQHGHYDVIVMKWNRMKLKCVSNGWIGHELSLVGIAVYNETDNKSVSRTTPKHI